MKLDNDNQPKRRMPTAFGPWVNTKEWALDIGSRFFFTGVDCGQGHFAKRSVKDGRCCECACERQQKAYWSDPEKKRQLSREDHQNNRERNLARMQAYANDNKEAISIRRAKFHEENRDRLLEETRQWHSENKDHATQYRQLNAEIYAAHARNRRARLSAAGGTHTADDVVGIIKRQKYKCAECGTSIKKRSSRHVDHIMPIALGGSNGPENLQVLCAPCNLSKNAKHPLEWARVKGRLV